MAVLEFNILKRDKKTRARAGTIKTRHGEIETPYFVPVATLASVRSLDAQDLESLGAQCALVNTYHLHLKPGDKLIKKLGGANKFMGFDRLLFSDSGGFQAFSLGLGREHNIGKIGNFFTEEIAESKRVRPFMQEGGEKGFNPFNSPKDNLTKITDKGITFRSIYDGSRHFFDAKTSMKIQSNLGTDIIMAFDECTSPLSDKDYTAYAMSRTHDWAKLSLKYHDKKQALYGIIQGGYFKDLREESTRFINALPFDGIAIGGSLGKSKRDMHNILDWVVPQLDEWPAGGEARFGRPAQQGGARPALAGRPRHLLGIGDIDDIFECVERGIDTFDCVAPTRNARRGSLFISPKSGGKLSNKFRINIKAEKFKSDKRPIDPYCACPTCQNYSRAYLRHLHAARELTYFRLATMHNLYFMLDLMAQVRESIKKGTFLGLKKKWLG